MKTKLLRKLRNRGRDIIEVYSITKESCRFSSDEVITGMSYGYSGSEYSELFSFGNTEAEVREKACKIYLNKIIKDIRKKYWRYSVKNKKMFHD